MKKTVHNVSFILILGVALGLLTSIGQTYIPEPFKQLANSYSVWLLVSFVVGLLVSSYKWAGFGGVAVQYLAIITYYIVSILRFDSGFSLSSNTIWIIGGTIAGPITALFAHAFIKRTKWSPYAIAFMASLFFSEALYQFLILKYVPEGWCFVVLGIGFLATLVRLTWKQRIITLAVSIVLTGLMFVVYAYGLTALFGG